MNSAPRGRKKKREEKKGKAGLALCWFWKFNISSLYLYLCIYHLPKRHMMSGLVWAWSAFVFIIVLSWHLLPSVFAFFIRRQINYYHLSSNQGNSNLVNISKNNRLHSFKRSHLKRSCVLKRHGFKDVATYEVLVGDSGEVLNLDWVNFLGLSPPFTTCPSLENTENVCYCVPWFGSLEVSLRPFTLVNFWSFQQQHFRHTPLVYWTIPINRM